MIENYIKMYEEMLEDHRHHLLMACSRKEWADCARHQAHIGHIELFLEVLRDIQNKANEDRV